MRVFYEGKEALIKMPIEDVLMLHSLMDYIGYSSEVKSWANRKDREFSSRLTRELFEYIKCVNDNDLSECAQSLVEEIKEVQREYSY